MNSSLGKRKQDEISTSQSPLFNETLKRKKVVNSSFKNVEKVSSPQAVVGPRNIVIVVDCETFLSYLLDILNFKFQANLQVVIPRVVLQELDERKRNENEGHIIRSAIRALQESMQENFNNSVRDSSSNVWFKSQAFEEGANVSNASFLSKEERIAQCALYFQNEIKKTSNISNKNVLTLDYKNKNQTFFNNKLNKGVVVLTKNPTLLTLCQNYSLQSFSPEQFLAMLPPVYTSSSSSSLKVTATIPASNNVTSFLPSTLIANTTYPLGNTQSSSVPKTTSIFDLVQGPTSTTKNTIPVNKTNYTSKKEFKNFYHNHNRPLKQVLAQGRDIF